MRCSRRSRLNSLVRHAMTMIELGCLMLVFCMALAGLTIGVRIGQAAGGWWWLPGLVGGGVAGILAAFVLAFLVMLPVIVWEVIGNARQPAVLTCTCGFAETGVVRFPIGFASDTAHLLDGLDRLNSVFPPLLPAPPADLGQERRALAALLTNPADPIAVHAPKALVYKHFHQIPTDLQRVLRTGLTPHLCLAWALACAERVIPVFEAEFHQDKRPQVGLGAAVLELHAFLRGIQPEIPFPRAGVAPGLYASCLGSGCRVITRSLWQRVSGWKSPGQCAADALGYATRAVHEFLEPDGLWRSYPPGDQGNWHMTAANRCHWALTAWNAERVAHHAAKAAADPAAELAWQRQRLAELILTWPTWDEDRRQWQQHLEDDWIPRIENELENQPFDKGDYIKLLRRTWLPWLPTTASSRTG